jgi:hypothetical protein
MDSVEHDRFAWRATAVGGEVLIPVYDFVYRYNSGDAMPTAMQMTPSEQTCLSKLVRTPSLDELLIDDFLPPTPQSKAEKTTDILIEILSWTDELAHVLVTGSKLFKFGTAEGIRFYTESIRWYINSPGFKVDFGDPVHAHFRKGIERSNG